MKTGEVPQANGNNYFAHTLEARPPEKWQTWRNHSSAVARAAAFFAGTFGAAPWAEVAGWLHDLGKLHPLFQAYLLRENGLDASEWDAAENGRINHSGAGAVLAVRKFQRDIGITLAYLLAGHHAGLGGVHYHATGIAGFDVKML